MTKRLCRCTCTVCGAVEFVGGSGGRFRCQACRTAGRFPVGALPYDGIGMNEAHSAVRRAVKRGELQPATAFVCVDCGKPAKCYDHRDSSGRFGALRSVAEAGEPCGLEHAGGIGRNGREAPAPGHDNDRAAPERSQGEHGLGIASAHRLHQHGAGPTNGHWRNADWLLCRDGLWRPVEPGTFPLAHGAPARVGRLRAYGNAIVAQVAAEIVSAYLECRP